MAGGTDSPQHICAGAQWLHPPGGGWRERAELDAGFAVILSIGFQIDGPPVWGNPLPMDPQPRIVVAEDPQAIIRIADAICPPGGCGWRVFEPVEALRVRPDVDRLVGGVILALSAAGHLGSAQPPPWLADLAGLISRRCIEPALAIPSIIAASGYSRSHVAHAFADCYGISIGGYLRRERIRLAARLLRELPWERVQVIAHRCGYRSAPLFHRHFRQMLGCAPRAWRREGDPAPP